MNEIESLVIKKQSEKIQALELCVLNIKDALLKEVKWCRDNQSGDGSQNPFVCGLEQAQLLINSAQKTLLMDERYNDGILFKV